MKDKDKEVKIQDLKRTRKGSISLSTQKGNDIVLPQYTQR
jgi:hypothetical protein